MNEARIEKVARAIVKALGAVPWELRDDPTWYRDHYMNVARTVLEEMQMDELKETVETLIELDEPEAMLATLKRAAERQKGERWEALAKVLGEAEEQLGLILNQHHLKLDAEPVDADAEAKTE